MTTHTKTGSKNGRSSVRGVSRLILCLAVLATAGATSDASAQERLGCFAEVTCVDAGQLLPSVVVPNTRLAVCERYKRELAREKELHSRTIFDAKKHRRNADQCVGDLKNEREDTAELIRRLERAHKERDRARAELGRRWKWYTWFGIGAASATGTVLILRGLLR